MAQFDYSTQPNYINLLQNILRMIARTPQLEIVAPKILSEAMEIAQAQAGFYIIVDDPHRVYVKGLAKYQLPPEDLIAKAVAGLSYDIHVSNQLPKELSESYRGWLLTPIIGWKSLAGVFGLLYTVEISLADETANMLMSLLDGLTIVTTSEQSEARHNKLTTNQNEFVRIVSHDLRSPLTSIKGFASMLEGVEQDEKKLHFTEKILNGVSQMTSLVDNIQDAGRYDPETGFYEMERTPTDLLDMVRRIVSTHLVPAEKGELTLTMNVSNDIPIVNVDANMIDRAIINLVDNAIKYTPNGGNIEVGLRKEDNNLLITVTDTGYGIGQEHIRDLFKRHTRIRRREHNRVKGSGLGLFIVQSVAIHHNGEAFVESQLNEGSTFGIRIPLAGENLLGGSQSG